MRENPIESDPIQPLYPGEKAILFGLLEVTVKEVELDSVGWDVHVTYATDGVERWHRWFNSKRLTLVQGDRA